jgi:hypothetical protein
MLHRWPAVRLGGVAPPDPRTIYSPFTLAGVANATQAKVTVTAPNGLVSTVLCSSSPCAIPVDARSGSVLAEVDYLNASGAVIAPGDQIPLYVAQ